MAANPMTQFEVYRIGPEIKVGAFDISFTNAITYMLFYPPLMYVFKTLFYNIRGSYSDDLAP